MIVNFEEVAIRRTRSGKCSGCGKKTSRVVKSHQTINPFNKGPSGLPKTREQIYVELKADLAERCTRPLYCAGCELARLDRTGEVK